MLQRCDTRRCLAQRRGTVGVNHTIVSRLATFFEVVAVTIRQYMSWETACSRWFWVRKGSDHMGVAIPASLL